MQAVSTPLRWFLLVAFCEGISYLVLVGLAMPLKYGLGMPGPVRVVGMAHGVLFVAYMAALAWALPAIGLRWAVVAALVSFVPGGTFWLDRRLRSIDVGPGPAAAD